MVREMLDGRTRLAFKSPETDLLEEYTLIFEELRAALAALKALGNMSSALQNLEGDNRVIATALYRDAIVRFIGCFDSTAKVRLDRDEIYGNTVGSFDLFDHLRDLRDSFIAHHYGAARVAYFWVEPMPFVRAWRFHVQDFQLTFPPGEVPPAYSNLIQIALDATAKKDEEVRIIIRQQLKELDIENILKLEPPTIQLPDGPEITSSRRHFRAAPGSPPPKRERSRPRKR